MSNQELMSAQPAPHRSHANLRRYGLPLLGLAAIIALLLALIPPEKMLGPIIRPVFLHGALVQAGLIAFAAAGVLGLLYFLQKSPAIIRWCLALQETAVAVWIVYALSSMVTTRLAWGEWIAWDEPRVRASIHVLWFAIACLLLVKWMNHPTFTAIANIVIAAAVWFLIKGAGLLRHPFDPIGGSNSLYYQVLYLSLLVAVLAFTAVVARWRSKCTTVGTQGLPAVLRK
jgi:hypothetical protein